MSARYGGPSVPGGGAPAGSALTTLVTATGNGTFDVNPAVAAGHKTMRLQLLAGGTGAGSGRRGAAGTVRCAGGPGANGAFVDVMVTIADVLALFPTGLVPYNVGAGTAGGAAVAVDDTNGNPGTSSLGAVNGTWFGAAANLALCIAVARPGVTAGSGGTNASGSAATPRNGTDPTGVGVSASSSGGAGSTGDNGGAGPGGGITTANAASAGGSGSATVYSSGAPGTAGVVDGSPPTSGIAGAMTGAGPAPGGGAASITTAAQAGANALPNSGAGGGSGGASLNGFASGAGGNGGSGFLRITTMG